jgi:2-polyprenyl-3-methyl-5-hydroxy-6-metoxy-1,4-benzoquinol methylase
MAIGWEASARAWIALQDSGEPARQVLLDPVMLRLCGAVEGRRVLDAGCGEGRFSRMLAKRGASVVGLDATRSLITAAAYRSASQGQWVRGSAAGLPFEDSVFDLVVSYLVLVDIPDFRAAISDMARVLRPGGAAVVANLSFMSVNTGWVRDDRGARLHYAMDRYLEERQVRLAWSGIEIVNWHRPLGAYMHAFLSAGLVLREFLEPMPDDDSLRADPYFEDWYRVPNFVVMKWSKPAE